MVFRSLTSLLLFLLALWPRVTDIQASDPQGDELFWDTRVAVFLQRVGAGDIAHATSHLGHPAIPAVLAMASARAVNDTLPEDSRVDSLTADRLGNAVFSSLVAPAVYLIFAPLLGGLAAFVAALFVVFDPQHVAVSRMAHVDSSFSLFVVLSVGCYLLGKLRGRSGLVLLSGVFWGASLACKPTALCIPAIFLVFNLIARYAFKNRAMPVVTWVDVWGVLLGFATLALLFTRFWHHNGPFLTELRAVSYVADVTYAVGVSFREHLGTLVAVLGLVVWMSYRGCSRGVFAGMATGAALTVALSLFPQAFENFIRYATRAHRLVDIVHRDLGTLNPRIPGGYLGVLAFQLPSPVVVLLCVGMVLLSASWWSRGKRGDPTSQSTVTLCSVVVVGWLMTLSVTPRNYVRYVVPVLPLLYILAAVVVQHLTAWLKTPAQRGFVAAAVPLVIGVLTVSHVHPVYLNYFNDIFGGVSHAAECRYPLFNEGHQAALDFIKKQPSPDGRPKQVAVIGELPVVARAREVLSEQDRASFDVSFLQFAQSADYVVTTEPLVPLIAEKFGQSLEGTQEVFRYTRDGVRFAAVYRANPELLARPTSFPLFGLKRGTGGTSAEDSRLPFTRTVLYAMPERHKAGMLFYRASLRVEPGEYLFNLVGSTFKGIPAGVDPHEPVLRVSLGTNCTKTITVGDLSEDFIGVPFVCQFDEAGLIELSGEWMGKVAFAADSFEVMRLSSRTVQGEAETK